MNSAVRGMAQISIPNQFEPTPSGSHLVSACVGIVCCGVYDRWGAIVALAGIAVSLTVSILVLEPLDHSRPLSTTVAIQLLRLRPLQPPLAITWPKSIRLASFISVRLHCCCACFWEYSNGFQRCCGSNLSADVAIIPHTSVASEIEA